MNNNRNILTSISLFDTDLNPHSPSGFIGLPEANRDICIVSRWNALVIADFGTYIRARAMSNSEQESITRVIKINKAFIREHSKNHEVPSVGTRFTWTFYKNSENRLDSMINIHRSLESFMSQIRKRNGACYLGSNEEIISFLYGDDE